MPNTHLQAIKHKLQSLRLRYYLVLLWHCLLICSLLAWLGYIFQLALGQAVWWSTLWGLTVPLMYSAYRIIKRPSLSRIAALADQRCELHDELVTAWQYRDSKQPALPLLLEKVSGDLDKIKPSLLFNFKISPRYAMVAVFLAGCSWYFYHNPWYLPSSIEHVQSIEDDQLQMVADQMEVFRKELNKMAPGAELPQVTKTAERLQQIVRELNYPETKSQAMSQLQELKQELVQSLPNEATAPEMTKGTEGEHKPALMELEVKSERLAKMMQKLNKFGLSSDQIQNQALRELAGLLDRLIRLNMPGQGTKPGGSSTQVASAKAGLSQTKAVKPKLPAAGLQYADNAGGSSYGKLGNQRYQSKDISRFGEDAYRAALQAKEGDLSPGDLSPQKYTYLPRKYQQQVYAVLADQHIPLYYRQQVMDYFDALRN